MRLALPLLLLFPLAACGSGEGTSIKINAKSDANGSSTTVSTDGNGQAAIKIPGFEGAIKLPQVHVNAENFDLNGVKLYPNSSVKALNVDAHSDGAGKDSGKVHIAFESPAAPATVQRWFRDKMAARGFKIEAAGDGLKGNTDEGEPFTLALAAEGDAKTKGTLDVGR